MRTEDEFKGWERKKSGGWKPKQSITGIHLVLIFAAFLVMNGAVSKGIISNNLFYTLLIGGALLFFFFVFKGTKETALISEDLAAQIVMHKLRRMQREGDRIPEGATIKIGFISGIKYVDNQVQGGQSGFARRDISVLVCQKSYCKKYRVGVHAYDGTVLDMVYESLGITGKENPNVRIVPVNVLELKKEVSQ